MTTNAALAAQVTDALTRWNVQLDQLADWLTGPAAGGPNQDGRYPLTNAEGETALFPSLPYILDMAVGPADAAGVAQAAAEAAETLAGHHKIAAELAQTQAELARDSAQVLRNETEQFRQDVAAYWAAVGAWQSQVSIDASTAAQAAVDAVNSSNQAGVYAGSADTARVAAEAARDAAQGYAASINPADLATKAELQTELNALVGAAPGTLDTLNELATALGNDPNFATTITTQLAGKADLSHTHVIGDVTGLQTALDGRALVGHGHAWSEITGKPTTFVPSAHTHAIGDVTGLQTALDGKLSLAGGTITGDVKFQDWVRLQDVSGTSSGMQSWISYCDGANVEWGMVGFGYDNTDFSITNWMSGDVKITAASGNVLLNGGNVGIGTSSPIGRFAVVGSAAGAGVFSVDTDATRVDIQSYNKPLAINRQGNNTLFNEGGGNVGVGTSSPGSKLEVTGDITQTWAAAMDRFVGSKFSTTYELGLHFLEATRETRIVSKAADSSGLVSIYTGVTPTERLRITSAGDVQITGSNLTVNGRNVLNDIDGKLSTTGNAATATKLATARNIALSGDVTGSANFDGSANVSITATVANDSHDHTVLYSVDDRDMKPNTSGIANSTKAVRTFFSSLEGMTGTAGTNYQDVMVLDTYSDSSGGNPNAITFDKSEIAVRAWQGAFNGTTWGTAQRFYMDNYHPNADKLTTARTISLTGDVAGSASFDGSANVSITATVADDSHNHIIANVDGLQAALDGKLSTTGTAYDSTRLGGIGWERTLQKRRYRIHPTDSTSLDSSIQYPETGFTYGGSGEPTGPYIAFGGLGGNIDYSCQLVGAYSGGNDFRIRTRNDDQALWNPWRTILTDGNYTSYVPTKGGAGASGTWGISITGSSASTTGNAATASKLATARNIALSGDVTGSANFDGSGNISITATVADDSHNHTIANVDGLQAALDGKAASSHTHSYLPLSGGTVTGNITRSGQGVHLHHGSSSHSSGKITVSTSAPSGGSNGDIWFKV